LTNNCSFGTVLVDKPVHVKPDSGILVQLCIVATCIPNKFIPAYIGIATEKVRLGTYLGDVFTSNSIGWNNRGMLHSTIASVDSAPQNGAMPTFEVKESLARNCS